MTQSEDIRTRLGFNLLDTETFAQGHPHQSYDVLRQTLPVLRHRGSVSQPAFWALTRYEDISAVSRNNKQFTSTKGFRLATDRRMTLDPEIGRNLSRFSIAMDPPEHTKQRAMINPSFTATALKSVEDQVRKAVIELTESLEGRDVVEFVSEVAAIVPIKTICAMMGVPASDERRVFTWTNGIFGTDDPDFALSVEESNRNYLEIFDYGLWLLGERRREPRDDLMTLVATATIDGQPLDPATLKGFFSNMLAAGNETTRSSLAGAIMALSHNKDQRDLLAQSPELIPNAVNELLRFFSPVIQMMRTATEDVEVGGQTIIAGERVVMLYGAGNHDPAIFADPHVLDVTRSNAFKHLTFGVGIHHCVGSRLAMMQLRIILEELIRRFPKFEVVGEAKYVKTNFVASMKSLPVRLH
ncbi:MAG: cytochrome P450 [Rhodospirillaceae bacterium]|nr:cytochrome P450 [Rhodospirillaceae bacterium]